VLGSILNDLASERGRFNLKRLGVLAVLITLIILSGCGNTSSSKAVEAAKERIIAEGEGAASDYKFSDVEAKLIQKEDRDLQQEGQIRVSGKLNYSVDGKRHYHFFGTTVHFYDGKYQAGNVTYETDYDSYER